MIDRFVEFIIDSLVTALFVIAMLFTAVAILIWVIIILTAVGLT